MPILLTAINTLTAWGKRSPPFSEPLSANWNTPFFLVQRYDIAFLKGDKAGMERGAALGRGKAGAEDEISNHEAFVLAYTGRLQQARMMSRRAVDLAAAVGPAGKGGSVRNRSSTVGSLFRECA